MENRVLNKDLPTCSNKNDPKIAHQFHHSVVSFFQVKPENYADCGERAFLTKVFRRHNTGKGGGDWILAGRYWPPKILTEFLFIF
jgi:hypothetical protein